MRFTDRYDAGRKLAELLAKYKNNDVVVYALPRGGVEVAVEIADLLKAPLDLIFAHKIGHPYQPEYAIAAVSESGYLIGNEQEMLSAGKEWLEGEKNHQMEEMQRRRKLYLKGRKEIPLKDKIAVIVDDGIATGLTMQVGIMELRSRHPDKIIAAVPVAPKSTARLIRTQVDEFVALDVPEDFHFLGAVGAYYDRFNQVEDEQVIAILDKHAKKADAYGKISSH